jgi:aminopeptidase N
MPALTEAEARIRAGLLRLQAYDVFLDLTADPVRSRTEIRFGCAEPGAATFADLSAHAVLSAVLNGRALGQPADGRLALPQLDADNVLTVEAEVACSLTADGLTRFTDPADGAAYVTLTCYPSSSSGVFCCFDQQDLTAAMTISVAAPAGWECVANGPVALRPPDGEAGTWRFGEVPGMRPSDLTISAGPLVAELRGTGAVALSVQRRASLAGADGVAGLAGFGGVAMRCIEWYERALGVPCPYPNYDIVLVPDLGALAYTVPGLMLVSERLLARINDPGDGFATMICAHEVAHLWFGSLVGMRWWDDVWLAEALATYLSYEAEAGALGAAEQWTAFCYRDKERAYRADELPGREPVSAPVASTAGALSRPNAITYCKGASVIRQLAALIGDDTLHAGLGRYLAAYRAAGAASLDEFVGCLSLAAGRDLAGWAGEWLRTAGASTLRAELTPAPGGTIGSVTVTQDTPRTHLTGIGLYDLDGNRLRRRRVVRAEVSGERTDIPSLAGEALPSALIVNDGDLAYAHVEFDERTFDALAAAAMDVGDPLTEAVCWNAAWRMVTRGDLAAADLADLIIRRLADLPLAGTKTLLDRAVQCADVYAPPQHRAATRERLADAAGRLAGQAAPGSAHQQALAAGFAASAQSDRQLGVLRSWLAGDSLPAGLVLTSDLHSRILLALSARGLATAGELGTLVARDPVRGEQNHATCSAMRPEPAAKETAWGLALAGDQSLRAAEAHARGLWVPGQEDIMAGYRDRYFAEALPALAGREPRAVRSLARLLYPATLVSAGTLAATSAALRAGGLSPGIQAILLEQEAVMRSALAARQARCRNRALQSGS